MSRRKIYINEIVDTFDTSCQFVSYSDGYYANVMVHRSGKIFNVLCSYYNNEMFTNNTVTLSWDSETNTLSTINFMRDEYKNSQVENEIINLLFSIPLTRIGEGMKTKSVRQN